MTNVIAEGGFNTGRLYTRHGQRIYWWHLESGHVQFRDRDRMIDGEIEPEPPHLGAKITPRWLMSAYDGGAYHMACFNLTLPADFDFGPMLRI